MYTPACHQQLFALPRKDEIINNHTHVHTLTVDIDNTCTPPPLNKTHHHIQTHQIIYTHNTKVKMLSECQITLHLLVLSPSSFCIVHLIKL